MVVYGRRGVQSYLLHALLRVRSAVQIIIIIIDIFYSGLNSKNYCKDHCSRVGDND